jgi:myo-inositol-1(or 4)-monophosphatase
MPKEREVIMADYREFAMSAAKEAGGLLKERFHHTHTISFKGRINIVTEADMMSEELLMNAIRESFPGHDIISEETKGVLTGSPYRWIIDPLDGTTNYAHGFPVFSVSIALEQDGSIILGVVYNPMLNELFVAERGRGAFLNEKKISVSDTGDLSKSLLATGFPYDIRENPDNNINYFTEMAMKARAIRRAGSAALDMAYIAAGRFDGFWELKLQPWDTAAGWLIVEEAGGSVTDISGEPYYLESPHIVATNGTIHQSMIDTLGAIDPLDRRLLK